MFLDPRFIQRQPVSDFIPIAQMPANEIRAAAGPLHFIFHTAFCCSTLLTRALDQPGVSMGLKEPSVLAAFAQRRAKGRIALAAIGALETTLNLLSRPLLPNETQIVKPSNTYNALIPQMLGLRPDAKAILLYSPLNSFLRAIVRRGPEGRVYARELYQALAVSMPLEIGFSGEQLLLQTDLQIAAHAWLMQIACFQSLVTHYPDRVRTLNSETFLADPETGFVKLCAFLNLDLDAAARSATLNGPVFREHAKQPGLPFSAAAYEQQLKAADGYALELAHTVEWASRLAGQNQAPMSLGDTLLA